MRILTVTALIACAIALAARPAAADEGAAREAFDKGGEAVEAGDFDEAVRQYRIAYQHNATWKLLYNIGQCEAAAKRYGLALEAFEQYLVKAGDDISLDRQAEVEAEVERLRAMVGFLNVSGPEGTVVQINDMPRGTLPITSLLPVSAAVAHQVVGLHDGKEIYSETVTLIGKQEYDVTIPPPAPPQEQTEHEIKTDTSEETDGADTTEPVPPASPSSPLSKAGVGVLIGGAVLVAGGFTMGGVSLTRARELDADNPDGLSPAQQDRMDSLQNVAIAGDILMGVGGALAVTGIVLLIVGKKRREGTGSARVTPLLGPVTGLSITGRF